MKVSLLGVPAHIFLIRDGFGYICRLVYTINDVMIFIILPAHRYPLSHHLFSNVDCPRTCRFPINLAIAMVYHSLLD